MKPIANKLTPQADALFIETQKALRGNLDRILSVSKDVDARPTKLPHVELAEMTGISRSTVAKLLAGGTEPSDANPDLRTISRLAEVLKVPPAFLLMTSADWTRLVSAIGGLQFVPPADTTAQPLGRLSSDDVASRAICWAEAIHPISELNENLLSDQPKEARERLQVEARQREKRARQSIKAMALAPAWSAVKGDAETLFAICVLMGASSSI